MATQRDQSPAGSVWALARRQHGVVARSQLLDLGLTEMGIKHRRRRGRLHSVRRGIYAVGRPGLTEDGRRMTVVLACGQGAVLSHRSAAELWEIIPSRAGLARDGVSDARRERTPPAPVIADVTVPSGRKPRPEGVRVHRRRLPPEDLSGRRGIPVTSPIRTLMDLACDLDEPPLEAAVVQADKLDLVDPEALRAGLKDRGGERGVAALGSLLDSRTFAITDSELERRFLRLVRRAGLAIPETGAHLQGFKLDFLWRDLGQVVETDGLRYHRTPAQQARDRRRDQVLTAAGLTPLRFTYEQVVRRPAEVASTLRSVTGRLASTRSARAA